MKTTALIFIALLFGGYALPASAACQSIPADEELAPVAFCETWTSVSVRIGDDERHYDKESFFDGWREIVSSWLVSEGLSSNRLDGASVEYWFSVPEANPLAAQIRLQVSPRIGPRFLIAGSPFPEEWVQAPTRADVAVLRTGQYPDDFGFRAGELLIQAELGVDPADVLDHLDAYSTGKSTRSSGSWYTLPTTPLAEQSVTTALQADPKTNDLVKEVYFNSLYEWIAFRQRAFAFSW